MRYSAPLLTPVILRNAWFCLALAVFSGGLGLLTCAAQQPEATVSKTQTESSTELQEVVPEQRNRLTPPSLDAVRDHKPAVRRADPNTIYLLDEEGNAQPFLDIPYEKFMELWRESQDVVSAREPGYTIDAIEINGKALPSHCELQVSMSFTLLADEVAIPLRMPQALLRRNSLPATDAKVQHLAYDESRGGFVLWLQGKKNEQRSLVLNVMVPLERQGNESLLRFNIPRATSSRLELAVDGAILGESASQSVFLKKLNDQPGISLLRVEGLAGEFELSWRSEEAESKELASVLRASSKMQVEIDGRSLRTTTDLTVESFGGKFDRFYVKLPPGAAIVEPERSESLQTDGDYSLIPQAPESIDKVRANDEQWVLVRLPVRQTGPVGVQINTLQPLGLDGGDLTAEIGGFEVWRAFRQFGEVSVHVDKNWHVQWDEGPYVRQVDPANATPKDENFTTATFQYDRQPWSLRAHVQALQSFVQATPQYELTLFPHEARLRVEIDYHIPEAPVFEMRTDMRGWQEILPPIESGGIVDNDRQTQEGHLLLQLAGASPKRAKVVINARRSIQPDESRLELPLPTPLVDVISPGKLLVVSAPNVSVAPINDRIRGLARDRTPLPTSLEEKWSGYRLQSFRTTLDNASFVAQREVLPQRVRVDSDAKVDVRATTIDVDQVLGFQVDFEQIQRILLRVPVELLEMVGDLDFFLLDERRQATDAAPERIEVLPMSTAEASDRETKERTIVLLLPRPLVGRFAVQLSYQLANTRDDVSSQTLLNIPLAVAGGYQTASSTATVWMHDKSEVALENSAPDAPWQIGETQRVTGKTSLVGDINQTPQYLRLSLNRTPSRDATATYLTDAWLQTWLAGDSRHMRAVYQFRTSEREVTLELPRGTEPENTRMLLNRKVLQARYQETGPVVIPIPNAGSGKLHTLEVQYNLPHMSSSLDAVNIAPPLLAGDQTPERTFWHFVLPDDQYLIAAPEQLTLATRNQKQIVPWKHDPLYEQADLEESLASSNLPSPTLLENQYLYVGRDRIGSLRVLTAKRWLLTLACSAVVLSVAFLVLYVPALRDARILAAFSVLLVVSAVAYPRLTVVFVQFAALGVGLAILAIALRFLTLRSSVQPPTPSSSAILTPGKTPNSGAMEPAFPTVYASSSSIAAGPSESQI